MKKAQSILMLIFGIVMIVSGVVRIAGALAEEGAALIPCDTVETLTGAEGEPLATLSVTGYYFPRPGAITVVYVVTNDCDLALTRITYDVAYLDDSGEALHEPQHIVRAYLEQPLPAGQTSEFSYSYYFDGAESTAGVDVTPVLADTELDLAPWTEPRPGNLLPDFCNTPSVTALFDDLDDNPPVELEIFQEEEGLVVVTDLEEMLFELERLRNTRIGGETDVIWTDSGRDYTFTFADGRQLTLSFNAPDVFYWHSRVYEVLGVD